MYPLRDTKLEPSFVFSSNHATVIENDELRKTKRGIEPKHLKEWGFLEVVGMSPDDYRKKCPSVRRINTVYISSASIFSSSFRISNEFWDGALLGLKISFACEGGSDSSFPSSILHASVQSNAIYIYISDHVFVRWNFSRDYRFSCFLLKLRFGTVFGQSLNALIQYARIAWMTDDSSSVNGTNTPDRSAPGGER